MASRNDCSAGKRVCCLVLPHNTHLLPILSHLHNHWLCLYIISLNRIVQSLERMLTGIAQNTIFTNFMTSGKTIAVDAEKVTPSF